MIVISSSGKWPDFWRLLLKCYCCCFSTLQYMAFPKQLGTFCAHIIMNLFVHNKCVQLVWGFLFCFCFSIYLLIWGGGGFVGWFSPFTLCTPEVKLRLDSKHLHPEPSHQALCFHILWFSFLYKQL